jgi:hypothetical protein
MAEKLTITIRARARTYTELEGFFPFNKRQSDGTVHERHNGKIDVHTWQATNAKRFFFMA